MTASTLSTYRSSAARFFITRTAVAVLLLLAAPPANSARAAQPPALALPGFSGLLNTPGAHVLNEGDLTALYSNQTDRFRTGTPSRQDNYLFAVGMFSFAEVGGRLTEAPGFARDLSANAKISSAPLTAGFPFAPAVALGMLDLGGGSNFFRSSYLAASADPLPWLRLSGGYGRNSNHILKGGFGGLELKACNWLSLLAEYDSRDTNAGLRLNTPPQPWFPASLTMTAKTAVNHSAGIDLAAGFSIPLDFKKSAVRRQGSEDRGQGSAGPALEAESAASLSGVPVHAPAPLDSELAAIRTRLIEAGFASVRVGVLGGTVLVVEYENVRYNHNELDALGVVAGISAVELEGIEALWLVVKRKGLRMLRVSAPLREMRSWLAGGSTSPAPAITVENNTSPVDAVRFIAGDSNPDWLRPSLMLYPGLKTYVGTEVGVFDYMLSLKPELQVTTWKGGVLNARADLPLAWSDNFDDRRQYAAARNKAQLDRLMLFQGINLAPGLLVNLGGGMILHDIYGTLNELTWSPGSGMHRFRLSQAWARDNGSHTDSTLWLGSYRLYLAPFDLFLEGTGGRFWGQDKGGLVTLKRFFGDTSVELYYKNTETVENKRWQAAGIQFSFPLTPRRDMARAPLQVRGADEWSYAQETVLAVNGQRSNDTLSSALGVTALPSADIYRSYLNRDRLNEEYILNHADRLKKAWQLFRHNLPSAWPAL